MKGEMKMRKDFLECTDVKECVEWYLEEIKHIERDAEFDRSFIASLFDNFYWMLEEQVLEIERKSRINGMLINSDVLGEVVREIE